MEHRRVSVFHFKHTIFFIHTWFLYENIGINMEEDEEVWFSVNSEFYMINHFKYSVSLYTSYLCCCFSYITEMLLMLLLAWALNRNKQTNYEMFERAFSFISAVFYEIYQSIDSCGFRNSSAVNTSMPVAINTVNVLMSAYVRSHREIRHILALGIKQTQWSIRQQI